ncbi:hypothetical protein D3C72_2300480 [compost metagenome]
MLAIRLAVCCRFRTVVCDMVLLLVVWVGDLWFAPGVYYVWVTVTSLLQPPALGGLP